MTTLLQKNIAAHISLSETEMESFCNLFEYKTIKKKSFLLREGEICKFEGFVTKGLFRVYHIDKNGFEQILYFAIEDWWITDIDSFTNLKSLYSLFIKYKGTVIPWSKTSKLLLPSETGNLSLFACLTISLEISLSYSTLKNI